MANTILIRSSQDASDGATQLKAAALKVSELAVNTNDITLWMGGDEDAGASATPGTEIAAAGDAHWIGAEISTSSGETSSTMLMSAAAIQSAIQGEDTLTELNDTNITSPADGALLLYDTGTSTWRDATISGATLSDTGAFVLGANSVDSNMYVDGSIDLAHMSVNSVDSDQYVDGSIDLAHMSANSVDSDQYVDASIDTAHFATGSVDAAALAPNAVTLAKMIGATDGNIISFDSSGDPTYVAAGTDGQVLTSSGAGAEPAFEDATTVTVNSNANNYIITGSGTANTLEAEANFQYSGTSATLKSLTSDQPTFLIQNSNADALGGHLELNMTSASVAADDEQGTIMFTGNDAGGGKHTFSEIIATSPSVTAGSESSKLSFHVTTSSSGALGEVMSITGGAGISSSTVAIKGDLTVAGTTTQVDTVTMNAQNAVVFEGATADAYETTLTITDPTADRTITLPNLSGTVVTTGDTGTVDATMMAANSVDSSELVDGGVDLSHMSANSVDSTQYVDGSIDLAHMSANSVDSDQYVDGSIDLAHMSANSVDSDQYVDGSIDLAHMSANSIDSTQYVDGSIDLAHMNSNSVDGTKILNDSIDSQHYIDGSIDVEHMSANSIDSASYVDGSIDTAHYAAGSVDAAAMGANSVDSSELVDGSVDLSHMSVNSIDSDQYVDGSIDLAHMSVNSIDSDQYVDGSIDSVHLAGSIADSKLNTISTAGKVDIGALEIDGASEMGAALVDADLFIVDDGGGGTEKSMLASRIPTYVAAATMTLTNTTINGGSF